MGSRKKRWWQSNRENKVTFLPNEQKRFQICMLLLPFKGGTSFADLCSYNCVIYQSYKETDLARELLKDDTEWHKYLEEMQSTHMQCQFRFVLHSFVACENQYHHFDFGGFSQSKAPVNGSCKPLQDVQLKM